MCGGSYCTSAVAPQVPCGGIWPLRRFNDWRASAGARSGRRWLPCPAAEPSTLANLQPTTPRARIGGKNRCTRRPTYPPRGGIREQNCGLWQLRRPSPIEEVTSWSPPHMIAPASAVRSVLCSGALINVQSLESVAFSFSWHPGATGWQVRHGKLLDRSPSTGAGLPPPAPSPRPWARCR
jgi:hypothetical protein